jgi:hypothetical protein
MLTQIDYERRASPQHDQNLATRLRETQGTSAWETGEAQAFAAGMGKSGSYLG